MSSYSAQEFEHLIMEPYIVQAEFSFKGSNNDELCFKKGDVITVTQREEGGWWEGTLNDTTGWFPSNYVKEYKASLPLSETIRPPEEIQESREIVLNELLESEKAHVAEIRGLLENFLEPLQTSQILNLDEYAQLMCNFTEIVDTHEELFRTISECEDRVGKLFLTMAPHMKKVHQSYCAAHPRAIVILDKYRDELELFMERQGAATPGLLVLTTGLSKPFRRLDKYSAMLQELERHMESGHPDRGDTQRSVAIYKDIAASCAATRRQKELELQVLTGPVRGWQGEELSTLGDIMHMGSVAVGPDHRDRYFVLFPQTLLILSVSQRMSAFIYEGKLPVAGIVVNRLEDSDQIKNAFEISGPLIEKIVAVCQGPTEANRWVEFLKGSNPLKDGRRATGIELKRNVSTSAVNIPQPPPHQLASLDSRGYSTRVSILPNNPNSFQLANITFPPKNYPPVSPYAQLTAHFRKLVKEGKITRFLVKSLLYPQVIQDIDKSRIAFRRKHKTTLRMYRRGSVKIDSSTNSSSDDDSDEKIPDNSDSNTSIEEHSDIGSCSSNPFGFVKYYTGKKSSEDDDRTEYESFIDHGSVVGQKEKTTSRKVTSTLSIEQDPHGSFCFPIKKQMTEIKVIPPRESLPICSKTVKLDDTKTPSRESVVHTSTARLNLGAIKQQYSDTSAISSFENRLSGENMACEDLVNIDESMQIKNTLRQKVALDERHSMPTLFVGNRFNNSSLTEVYIPSWKDRHEIQKISVCNTKNHEEHEESYSTSPSTTTHSSSIDLPAMIPAPDKLAAEVMYNLPPDSLIAHENIDIIKPPSMFGNRKPLLAKRSTSTLSTQSLHSPSVDKSKDETKKRPESVRRCISVQFVDMDPNNGKSNLKSSKSHGKCTCCESPQCHSPRSSDSGMAGSCTIASDNQPKNSDEFYYPFENYNISNLEEYQRHQFELARREGIRHSLSSHNIGRFSLSIANNKDNEKDNTDSGQYGDNSLVRDEDIFQYDCNRNSKRKTSNLSLDVIHEPQPQQQKRKSKSTKPSSPICENPNSKRLSGRCRSIERSLNLSLSTLNNSNQNNTEQPASTDPSERLYRTGLYAHWWKKEKLPGEIIRELYRLQKRNELGSIVQCSTCDEAISDTCSLCSCRTATRGSRERSNYGDAVNFAEGSDVAAQSRQFASHPRYSTHHANVSTQTQSFVQSSFDLQPNETAPSNSANSNEQRHNKSTGAKRKERKHKRPAPPLRPSLLNSSSSSNLNLSNSKRLQPTYEEDALVLKVIEAYCAAYQNNSRNTIHSGLENDEMTPTLKQLWTSVRQLQQDVSQLKSQINEERELRGQLQQLLMEHLEKFVKSNTC